MDIGANFLAAMPIGAFITAVLTAMRRASPTLRRPKDGSFAKWFVLLFPFVLGIGLGIAVWAFEGVSSPLTTGMTAGAFHLALHGAVVQKFKLLGQGAGEKP